MSDLIERLRKPSDSEETMNAWDGLRAYLLKGGRGSYARDIFEAILSHIDEEREEAAERLAFLEREVEELLKALSRQGDNMAFVLNHATLPEAWYRKFTDELEEDRTALRDGGANDGF